METPTRTFRSGDSGVHRFNPRTFEVEFHFPIGPNPHGDVFDQWGYQFANDGTGGVGSYVNIGKGIGNKPWFKMRVRPVAATGILSSSHFPEANQGNFLICNCIGFLGVLQHEVKYHGADIQATEIEPILVSSDPNFRPSDVEIGGDGALYVADWSNAIIGHMQHNMRDPNRDHEHGRIYRVTAKDRPLLQPTKLIGKPIPEVLQAFFAKENGARYRARIELSGRDSSQVAAAIKPWAARLKPSQPEEAQALLEALWVLEEHRLPDLQLVQKVYAAEEPRVRAAAIRTLGHWAKRIPDAEPLLMTAARDASPLVRAEATKAAVEFASSTSAEVVYEVAMRPLDAELTQVLKYARSQLKADEQLQRKIDNGETLSEAAQQFALLNANADSLLKLPQSEEVFKAVLSRLDASTPALRKALAGLASLKKGTALPVLMGLIAERDEGNQADALRSLAELLLEQPTAELKKIRGSLQNLALHAKLSATRQLAFAAWIVADGTSDGPFASASASKENLRDLLTAIPFLPKPEWRESSYAAVRSLMFELPPALQSEPLGATLLQSGIQVDYYHPSPSNVALETLAARTPNDSGVVPEIVMQVPQRKEQDAFALRFTGQLHLTTSGNYRFFLGSDDGSRLYLDGKLLIDNDGLHGMVEKQAAIDLSAGYHPLVVTYFDNGGGDGLSVNWSGPGFERQAIPAERLSLGSGSDTLHDLAIRAAVSIPGHDSEKFSDWTRLIKTERHRASAIPALKSLPDRCWEQSELPSLVDNLISFLSSIPAKDRTVGLAVETSELVKLLAAKLPADQTKKTFERLQNLDVRTIAIGTVVERMIYDKEKVVVQAGRPVEFRFSNTDNMPHNFVIVKPGTLEEVGLLAEATAQDADARERNFVPKSKSILLASKLVDAGQSQAIAFDVPTTPGMYPYVCTYPGHWRRMFGVLVVVKNLDEYQANPEAYLAANPLPYKDELLQTLGRNTEWKYEDIAADLKELEHGRSFEVGQSLFKAANCTGCHQLGGIGQPIGPDLAKLDAKKMTAEFLLKSILQPSLDIEEKYQSQIFQTSSGTVFTGVVLEETAEQIKLLVDPLAKGEPLLLDKDEIEGRKKSTTSIMPQGLLSRLTKEEILDLLAYVKTKGDKENKIYQAHSHHKH